MPANAFVAKAVLGLPTTAGLIERLAADRALRRICGFLMWKLPAESTFLRAFAEFAEAGLAEQPRPVVRAGAGAPADQARRQVGDQRQQVCAGYFRFDQYGFAAIIDVVHGKDVLGEVDSYGDNAYDFPLLLV